MELTLFILKTSDNLERYLCTDRSTAIQRGDFVKISSPAYNTTGVVSEVRKVPNLIIEQDGYAEFSTYFWKYINRGYITIDSSSNNNTAKDCIEELFDLTLFTLIDPSSKVIRKFAIATPVPEPKKGQRIDLTSKTLGTYEGTIEYTQRLRLMSHASCEDLKPVTYNGHDWMFVSNPTITHISIESPSNNNTTNISKTNSMKTNKIFDTMMERFKAQFMPVVDESLQVTMDGEVAVPTKEGDFVAIKGEELTSYPAEMTLDMPVYVLAKKVEDVKAGDIIKSGSSYSKVTKVNKNNQGKLVSFSTLSYSGHGKTVKPITDFLMGQSTVKVVINLMSGFSDTNGINPMMLMALKDGDSNDSLMMLLLMQQMNGGAQAGTNPFGNINPMMLMLMGGEGNNDTFKTIMMMQMMQGNMNLFGAAPAATPAAE